VLDKLGRQGRGGGDATVGQLLTARDGAGWAVILDLLAWRKEGGKEGRRCERRGGEEV